MFAGFAIPPFPGTDEEERKAQSVMKIMYAALRCLHRSGNEPLTFNNGQVKNP
jgi:hypothetical protein